MNCVLMGDAELKHIIATAAGVLAYRQGSAEVDKMLRNIGDRLVLRPKTQGDDSTKTHWEIIDEVCRDASVTRADVLGQNRARRFVQPRHECWRRLSAATIDQVDGQTKRFSSVQIGKWFGCHHTSVLHGINRTSKSKARIGGRI